jgi:hypothetical protein
MSWAESPGAVCNTCRRDLPEGEHVWKGEVTPAFWCHGCAASMGQHYQGTLTAFNAASLLETHHAFAEGLRALKARAAMKVRRTVTIGGDE